MRAAIFLVLLLFLSVHAASAEDKAREEADMLLLKASDLERFKAGEIPKYRLDAEFSFLRKGMPDVPGTFLVEYDSAPLWREELEFSGFIFKQTHTDKQTWTLKNDDFIPLPVEDFWRALRTTSFRMTDVNVVKRVRDRRVDGIDDRCIEFESVRGKNKENGQLCVEKNTGFLVYWQYDTREVYYSGYSPFAGGLRPRHIKVVIAGQDSLVADVTYAKVTEFDADTFKPIVGGELRKSCRTSRAAIAKYAPDPVTPNAIASKGYKGKVIVKAKIGIDGRVEKAVIAQTVEPALDEAALEAVQQWQFEPSTCDGEAVTTILKLEVDFK